LHYKFIIFEYNKRYTAALQVFYCLVDWATTECTKTGQISAKLYIAYLIGVLKIKREKHVV